MRSRLRPAYSPAEQAALYSGIHDHTRWPDHVLRVNETIALGGELIAARLAGQDSVTIADLSCGDAAIARHLAAGVTREGRAARVILGDLVPGWDVQGPIETTIESLSMVDLLVCTETLEHLDDPDAVLRRARAKAGLLLVSTPDAEPEGVNPEHLWTWDRDGLREMLTGAGWEPVAGRTVSWEDENRWTWAYQIWGCE